MGDGTANKAPDDPGGRYLVPAVVKGIAGARKLSIGDGHVAALLADGTLRMWGFNGYGQLGTSPSGGYQGKPVKPVITNVTAIFATSYHSIAVRTDGAVWIWGAGITNLDNPTKVPTRFDLP